MLATIRFLAFHLVLEAAVLKIALSQGNMNGQDILRSLLAEEITEALQNFTCSVPDHLPSLKETVDDIAQGVAEIAKSLTALNERVDSLQLQIDRLDDDYGLTKSRAAHSCAEIIAGHANSSSGYYWVRNATGHPHRVYCDMTRSCGGVTRGWMRVAYLDMTLNSRQCPPNLWQHIHIGKNGCSPYADSEACSSAWYPSHGIEYSRVCGSIRGYFYGSLDGFNDYGRGTSLSIDSNYVDGVSLTHGTPIRNHIWTFAVRWDCPCGHTPAFIGNDYFCNMHKHNDLHWNIGNCSGTNICCNPPGFHKHLLHPTTDDIEMRLCRDQDRTDEDVFVPKVEIYVM